MSAHEIRSPLPGTFYRRPSPESESYKNDGDSVGIDDVIGLIEVMKSFHEVKAGVNGEQLRFLLDNESPVSSGQVLAVVETA